MKIHISGRHIDTGQALRVHVEDRLPDMVSKYFADVAEASITFSKQGVFFETSCAVHLDSGLYLHASGNDSDIYHSFDQSLAKLEKQLRRYKRRLKNHHKQSRPDERPLRAPEKILAPESNSPEDNSDEAPEEFTPIIIAENEKIIPYLTIGEAVMQLEIGHSDFVIFKSTEGDKLQLIYRRADQNIGWMEL